MSRCTSNRKYQRCLWRKTRLRFPWIQMENLNLLQLLVRLVSTFWARELRHISQWNWRETFYKSQKKKFDKSSSSEDEADKKPSLSKDSVEKLQSQRPSRIPILAGQKKNKIEKDKFPMKNVRAVMGEKPVGRDSGMVFNLNFFCGHKLKSRRCTLYVNFIAVFIPVKCFY